VSAIEPFLQRNRTFAESDARSAMTLRPPRAPIFVITCIDPRVDPAAFLGVGLGDAIVLRNAGGRVSEAAISDIAFISYLGEKLNPDASAPLEVAVIHHTQCGTGFLADDTFRHGFARRTGFDDAALAAEAVTDPTVTVTADVERLLASPLATGFITVSDHVYDLATGLVSTVLPPAAPHLSVGRGAA